MFAVHPTRHALTILVLCALLTPMLVGPALAASVGHAPAETTVVARVDGSEQRVQVQENHGNVRLESGHGVQLCVVDLGDAVLPATAVDFSLERSQRLRLEVLDLDGQLVRTIAEGLWAEGRHQLAWQHDAESGDRLEEGQYVVRLVPEAAGEMVALAR